MADDDAEGIKLFLSPQALDAIRRYETWQDSFDAALESIRTNPYPPDWDAIPHSTLKPDQYEGCIVQDYPPFQYVYQFDAPDEITVLVITLCFPYSVTM